MYACNSIKDDMLPPSDPHLQAGDHQERVMKHRPVRGVLCKNAARRGVVGNGWRIADLRQVLCRIFTGRTEMTRK